MKLVGNKVGLLVRLGLISGAMLFSQQALAEGTQAGTTIENTATVDYFVGGVDQDDLTSNTVTFVVDRRVQFTLTQLGSGLVPVTPGGNDYFFDLLLTNTSNDDLDFKLVLDQLTNPETVRGQTDTADMTAPEYAVNTLLYTGSEADPVQGGPQYVDNLGSDDAIRIRVWGDAALTMANGQIAGLDLTATASELSGTEAAPGADLDDTAPPDDLTVQNVFADADNDGVEVQVDGFIVETAALSVAKSYAVIAGDLGSGMPIPGATVEYTITVTNSSTTADATSVPITDALDADVTFLTGQYSGLDIEIDNDGTVSQCSADPAASDTDGCSLDGVNLVVGNANGPITVAQDPGTGPVVLTVRFQVQIPDPATTP